MNFKDLLIFMTALFTKGDKMEALFDENGKLTMSSDMDARLQKELGPKANIAKIKAGIEAEYAEVLAAKAKKEDPKLAQLREAAKKALLIDHDLSAGEADKVLATASESGNEATEKELLQGLMSKVDNLASENDEQKKQIAKLLTSAEDDTPLQLLKNLSGNMKHSAIALFGSTVAADSFENRPWNQRAAGLTTKPTDWASEGKLEIQQLKGDIDAFYRAFPDEIRSLHRDLLGLPSHWRIQTNVSDSAGDGSIVTGEISQARKLPWLPKNNQSIQAEKRKVFPVHIDIEFAGYWLQKIETNFIGDIYNKEGSQPYKWVFVRFLLKELDKQARLEDRIVATRGVYVPTPETATIPGLAIHRGDGIFIQMWRALFYKKQYKTAQVGKPTTANIVDYVKTVIEKNLPEDTKNTPGLYFYLSPSWLRAHKERKRIIFGQDSNYNGADLVEIENYENFKFQPLRDLEGTDFMFITTEDNIVLMENLPKEKSMYHMDSLKRILYIFADYKWGAGLRHIGNKIKDGDPLSFKVQTLWTNGLNPIRDDFFVRLYDDTTGEVAIPYSNITITDDWTTDIETITNTYDGQIVKVRGNASATGNVTDDGNISLAGNADFDLATGGTLTLRAAAGGTLTEVKRTTTAPTAPSENATFSGTSIDANEAKIFEFNGATATMTGIENGIENQEIQIFGGGNGDLTITDVAGNIEVASNAVLGDADDYIKLTLIDGVWTEVERDITA